MIMKPDTEISWREKGEKKHSRPWSDVPKGTVLTQHRALIADGEPRTHVKKFPEMGFWSGRPMEVQDTLVCEVRIHNVSRTT